MFVKTCIHHVQYSLTLPNAEQYTTYFQIQGSELVRFWQWILSVMKARGRRLWLKDWIQGPSWNSSDIVIHTTREPPASLDNWPKFRGKVQHWKPVIKHHEEKNEYSLLTQLLLYIVHYFCIWRNRSFKYYEIILLLCISSQLWTMNYRNTHITPCMLPPNLKACPPSYIYSFSPFSSFSYYPPPAPPHCSVWVDKLLSSHTSGRRQWHPTPVLLPGKSHGWRSLMGYSPWGR